MAPQGNGLDGNSLTTAGCLLFMNTECLHLDMFLAEGLLLEQKSL